MKTVLITSNAYFPNIGGIENSLRYLARSYSKKGYKVYVVVSDINNVTTTKLPKHQKIDNIEIFRYPTEHNLNRFMQPFAGIFTLYALYKQLRYIQLQFAPDFTISRFHTTTWMARLAKLNRVVYLLPGVVKFQNHPSQMSKQTGFAKVVQYLRYYYHVWLQRRAFKAAQTLAVFSENMQEQVLSCFCPKNELLLTKPGVDSARFAPPSTSKKQELKHKFEIAKEKTTLLCIGRFVSAKGFKYVLEAMRNLDNYHLLLVGGGEEEEVYRDFVDQYNLTHKVTFTGVIQDPISCYQAADIFIMSSIYEPLGQTILEALSSGLPVVAFSRSGSVTTATEELLSHHEAIFVDKVDSIALAKSIEALCDEHQKLINLRMISREIAKQRFSWDALAETLEQNALCK